MQHRHSRQVMRELRHRQRCALHASLPAVLHRCHQCAQPKQRLHADHVVGRATHDACRLVHQHMISLVTVTPAEQPAPCLLHPTFADALRARVQRILCAVQEEATALGATRSTIGRAGSAVASAAGAVGQGAFGVAAAVAAALQLRQVRTPVLTLLCNSSVPRPQPMHQCVCHLPCYLALTMKPVTSFWLKPSWETQAKT